MVLLLNWSEPTNFEHSLVLDHHDLTLSIVWLMSDRQSDRNTDCNIAFKHKTNIFQVTTM